jgi:2,4-dienoyl-CoA reductase-like NADH-dependent reductase (Old Yellow Enzyme family)
LSALRTSLLRRLADEVHEHGAAVMIQFLDSFCIRFWNHPTDEFGGSYENRMRCPLQSHT